MTRYETVAPSMRSACPTKTTAVAHADDAARLPPHARTSAVAARYLIALVLAAARVDAGDSAARSPSAASPAGVDCGLTAPQIERVLNRFVAGARGIPGDAQVLSRDFLDARRYASGSAGQVLDAYARDAAPYARLLAHERNVVDRTDIVDIGGGRYAATWTETRVSGETVVTVEHWRATFAISLCEPGDGEAARNPSGVYIRGLEWMRTD